MIHPFRASLILLALFLAAGCIHGISTKPFKNADEGIPYYLPKARIVLTLDLDAQPKWMIGTTVYSSDTSTPLRLVYHLDPFADEQYCVARNENGTLQTILFDTADRTGDILVKVAETAATLALRAPTGGFPGAEMFRVSVAQDRTATVTFDPCDETEKGNALEILRQVDSNVEIDTTSLKCSVGPKPGPPADLPPAGQLGDSKSPPYISTLCSTHSVCYRTLTTLPLHIRSGKGGKTTLWAEFLDYEHLGVLDIDRVFLTRTLSQVSFNRGVLTDVALNRPSMAWEIASLPLRIINSVLDVPASFFAKIASGFSSQASANSAAAQLLNAQALLAQTQAKPSPGDGSNPNPPKPSGDIGSSMTGPQSFDSKFQCIGKKSNSWLIGS